MLSKRGKTLQERVFTITIQPQYRSARQKKRQNLRQEIQYGGDKHQ